VPVGSSLTVRAIIKLGSVGPHDVNVQLQHGPLGADGGLAQVKTTEMALSENKADGQCLFKGTIACSESGEHGFSVRVLPSNPDLSCVHETHLVLWSS
jgi:starch phosphorylase